MKRLLKKISVLLVIALIVTTYNPINNLSVSAATKATTSPTWGNVSNNIKTLYVGSKYTIKLKNSKSNYYYVWSTSNNKIATITKKGVVTAQRVGKATITCTIKNNKTYKVIKTLRATFTINESATGVTITNPITNLEVKPNAYDFDATTTTKSGDPTTDQIYWLLSDNTAGATVDNNGVVNVGNIGGFKLQAVTATSINNFNAGKYTAISQIITVQVPLSITSVKQVGDHKVEVQFNTSVKDQVKDKDFSIANASTYELQQIKSISYSNDNKTVIIETYNSFANNYSYKLTYNSKDYTFAVSNGDVASIVIKTDKIPSGKATAIDYTLYDANGTDVTLSKKNTASIDIELVEVTKGYIDSNKKITLISNGDTAKVRITYHTYKYVNGKEVAVTAEGLITAVDQSQVTPGNYEKYTIAKNTPNWSSVTSTLNTLSISDTDYTVYVLAKDSYNGQIPASSIKYSSSDDSRLLVSQNGALCPLKEGNVYVIATCGNNIWTLPITIVGERKASSISVDKPIVTVSNSVIANDYQTVVVSLKDQFGNDYKKDTLYVSDVTEATNRTGAPAAVINGTKIIFYGAHAVKGDYNYIITAGGLKINVVVKVVEPTNEASVYNLDLSAYSVDTAVTDLSQVKDKSITMRVGEYKGGILYNYKNIKSIIITLPDNTEYKPSINGNTFTFDSVTMASSSLIKAAQGTYKVEVTIVDDTGKDINLTSGFKIYDTQQTLVNYSINSLNTYKNTIRTAITDCISLKDSAGNAIEASRITKVSYKSTSSITSIDSILSSGTKVYIDTITLSVKSGNAYIDQTITIGQTFSIQ
ncbi:Ig-like domain-containing protein [Anaeromicropila herbilytica]|uniref:BIG2 domain-containing protein n=1 Tax=Anaeromicropila herbilytica TaxID=2785025 RepID=A0A7R7IEP2_9FIRM|nr:Ig-like domain-containing protein [Anaeromicropila herbilytica]BCN32226.1 hypothetical protein bsdtb5_35210 [Anaeromicropila herbilytica]